MSVSEALSPDVLLDLTETGCYTVSDDQSVRKKFQKLIQLQIERLKRFPRMNEDLQTGKHIVLSTQDDRDHRSFTRFTISHIIELGSMLMNACCLLEHLRRCLLKTASPDENHSRNAVCANMEDVQKRFTLLDDRLRRFEAERISTTLRHKQDEFVIHDKKIKYLLEKLGCGGKSINRTITELRRSIENICKIAKEFGVLQGELLFVDELHYIHEQTVLVARDLNNAQTSQVNQEFQKIAKNKNKGKLIAPGSEPFANTNDDNATLASDCYERRLSDWLEYGRKQKHVGDYEYEDKKCTTNVVGRYRYFEANIPSDSESNSDYIGEETFRRMEPQTQKQEETNQGGPNKMEELHVNLSKEFSEVEIEPALDHYITETKTDTTDFELCQNYPLRDKSAKVSSNPNTTEVDADSVGIITKLDESVSNTILENSSHHSIFDACGCEDGVPLKANNDSVSEYESSEEQASLVDNKRLWPVQRTSGVQRFNTFAEKVLSVFDEQYWAVMTTSLVCLLSALTFYCLRSDASLATLNSLLGAISKAISNQLQLRNYGLPTI